MSLQKVKILSGFDIYQKKYESTNKTNYFSWLTNYLDSDITNTTFKSDDKYDIVEMDILHKNINTKLKIKINSLNNFIFESDNKEIENIINQIKCKYNNLYDILLFFSKIINLDNESYNEEYLEENNDVDNECEDESYDYESESEKWNPYEDFEIITQNDDFISMISRIKRKANEKYKEEGFDSGKLTITSNFIINVIVKEIESINKNCKFVKVNPINDNMFDIDIHFKDFNNQILSDNLNKLGIDSILMNIKLNHNLYPYYPPQVSFKTKLDNKLDIAIINLSYFNPDSWNPTNTMEQMIKSVHKILNDNCELSTNEDDMFPIINSLIQNIMSFNSILPICLKNFDINIDFVKLNSESNVNSNDSKHWASGVGYGYNGRSDWDINEFIETKKIKIKQNTNFMNELDKNIKNNINEKNFKNYILNSGLIEILCVFIKQINLVELDNNSNLYLHVFNILDNINLTQWEDIPISDLSNIAKALEIFCIESTTYIKINKNIDVYSEKYKIIKKSNSYYDKIKKFKIKDIFITNDSKIDYCKVMKPLQFDGIEEDFTSHFYKEKSFNPEKQCLSKISKELSTYHNSLPLNYESSVFVRYNENNVQLIKALIIGPDNTPYENGCFLFDIYIPDNYPSDPPLVNLQTTGYGKVRFNPNLYNSGKVCLSILNTWSGSQQEKWNKDTSTLLQVLVSIQSLIFVENPYFNEPGYEADMHTEQGKRRSMEYNDIRRKATIEWAMIDLIKNPLLEFKDIILNHFKYKKDNINNTIEKWYDETKSSKSEYNKIKNNISKLLSDF